MKKKTKLIEKKIINKTNTIQSIVILIVSSLSFLLDKIMINVVNAIQHPLLFNFFYAITSLGEVYIFIFIALVLIATLMIYHRPITEFILTLFTAEIIQVLIKLIVNRPRPFEAANIASSITTNMSSFPSGHTMMFFAMIPIFSKNFPKMKIVLLIVATLVGVSRIYLGVHYLSDVVFGAILGYSIGWIYMRLGEKYAWKY